MVTLQESKEKLANFKHQFGNRFGITKLGIFGSVARGENNENSDIDIVVEVEKPTLLLMHNLHEELVALFNCKVDLVRFRKSLRPLLRANINQEAVYV